MSDKKPSFLDKLKAAGDVYLDSVIAKSRSEIAMEEDDAQWRKSVYKDVSYNTGVQGFQDRGARLSFQSLRQMAAKSTIVAGIIQTRQNQVAAYSKLTENPFEKGWKISLRNEKDAIEELKRELFGDPENEVDQFDEENSETIEKADAEERSVESGQDLEGDIIEGPQSASPDSPSLPGDDNEDGKISEREKDRKAKEELNKRIKAKVKALSDFIENCGKMEDKPFEDRQWNMDSFLRAITRDSLELDQYPVEMVPDQAGKLHHFVPVDGATIRKATPQLAQYRKGELDTGYDILYPEKELEALKEDRDALELDEEKLKNNDYKYVQVVRGRVERAFTPEELCVGTRNPTTNIYANGYGISELELLIGVVTSHIFTEHYNHSYYTNGFSAKGILHIKAPLPRRKLETVRIQWKHMFSGARNSFQTPIFAGMDEIQWIPLTQNHSDMEFSRWMNYLIKIICMIYQIDPIEIGFGMREEGGTGGSLGGDNTKEKQSHSRDKGLVPLLRNIENFITKNIVERIDADFKFEFVGLEGDAQETVIERQSKEAKFKKSVNEIRAEDGLPPIPGCDDLILEPTYFQWFTTFHPEGKAAAQQSMIQNQLNQFAQADAETEPGQPGEQGPPGAPPGAPPGQGNPMEKSFKTKAPVLIEYYLKD